MHRAIQSLSAHSKHSAMYMYCMLIDGDYQPVRISEKVDVSEKKTGRKKHLFIAEQNAKQYNSIV